MHLSNTIAKIIESCLDDRKTLLDECRNLDPSQQALLTRLAAEREEFVRQLEQLSPAPAKTSWRESLRLLGTHAFERAAGPNTGDSIAACKRSQARTTAEYEKALELDLPSDVRTVLTSQYERIRVEREELTRLEFGRAVNEA